MHTEIKIKIIDIDHTQIISEKDLESQIEQSVKDQLAVQNINFMDIDFDFRHQFSSEELKKLWVTDSGFEFVDCESMKKKTKEERRNE